MSARLYAATGDSAWRDRYLEHVELLDQTLEATRALVANAEAQNAIDQVADANAVLIALEDRALGLTAGGRSAEALALLVSPSYEQAKISYQQVLKRAIEISRGVLRSDVDGDRAWLFGAALMLVISLLCLSELWRRLSLSDQRQAVVESGGSSFFVRLPY